MSGFRVWATADDYAANASFEEILEKTPRELRRAVSRAAGNVRRRMISTVRRHPVPRAELSRALRTADGRSALTRSTAIKIRWLQRPAYGVNVDWIEPLRPYASRFMDGGPVGLQNPSVRRALHIALGFRGRRDVEVDPGAVQPRREVLGPVLSWAGHDFERNVRGALRRVFADAAKKGAAAK